MTTTDFDNAPASFRNFVNDALGAPPANNAPRIRAIP